MRSTTIASGILFWILLSLAFGEVGAQKPIKDLKDTVILISIDGFRYDYLDKYQPPTLQSLAARGVRAKWLIPSFPTKTFPNHYTIVTGLYPENHGIIENNIWDFGTTFSLGSAEVRNARWWLGEPIWVTAEKQGQRAASFFWPGSEAPIGGLRPSYWKPYKHDTPHEERIDTVLQWLDLPRRTRPTFITLYFSDVDDAGHRYSPESAEAMAAISKVDNALDRLMNGLRTRKIERKVNLIVVSDHGMATVDKKNAVIMDKYLNYEKTERVLWTGEIVQIFPKPGLEESVIAGLQKIENATCWRRSQIPERLHYRNSPRIAPIVCSAHEGWYMTSRSRFDTQKARGNFDQPEGHHGYDNSYESMRAVFIAHGKDFPKGKVVEAFENIEIYNLLCELLDLKPAKNDGKFDRIKKILKK